MPVCNRGQSYVGKLIRFSGVSLAFLCAAPMADAYSKDSATRTITISSSEGLQLAPIDQKEWYERGWWPVAGAVLALIITNAVSVRVVYVQSEKSFNAVLRQRKIDTLSTSLNEFYNPLIALIDINGEIFSKTGPSSFPKEEPGLTAAGKIWKETKKNILDNNTEILRILRVKSHLLHEDDKFESYHALLVHVAMYDTFQRVQTDLYKKFMFPSEIREHIFSQRLKVLEAYYQATGEQI